MCILILLSYQSICKSCPFDLSMSFRFWLYLLNVFVFLSQEIGKDFSPDGKRIALEFISSSDNKEAVMKAANILLQRYLKSSHPENDQGENFFTESHLNEALGVVGLCWFSHIEFKSLLSFFPWIWCQYFGRWECTRARSVTGLWTYKEPPWFPCLETSIHWDSVRAFNSFSLVSLELNLIEFVYFLCICLLIDIWELWSIWDMVPFWRQFTSSQVYTKTMVSLSSPTTLYTLSHTHSLNTKVSTSELDWVTFLPFESQIFTQNVSTFEFDWATHP